MCLCSGLSQYDYFNYATQLVQSFGTPAAYTTAALNGGSINANDLRDDFGGADMASLQCSGGDYINGVFTCWSTVNGVPSKQVVCPSDVQVHIQRIYIILYFLLYILCMLRVY